MELLGFELTKKKKKPDTVIQQQSFSLPEKDDGALTVASAGAAYYGTYVDIAGGSYINEVELITRYREMSIQPEIESAMENIVNEAIVTDDDGQSVKIVLDDLKQPEKVKKSIIDEFENVKRLLNYNKNGADIFRRWFTDGRIYYQVIADPNNTNAGIKELKYIDPRKIKKVREVKKERDIKTGVDVMKTEKEYYVYNERINMVGTNAAGIVGIKIEPDSIINVNSGLMDSRRSHVLSYLHKAIKPLNCLRMMEDATVIYCVSRAPERRVFYIDVGNLPKAKAEQYVRDIMTKYKNKIVYDANTGEIKDDRKYMSMLEDFWLPRREGGKGTEITTLPAGQNLGQMDNVLYFEKKLYKSLNVPLSRLDPTQGNFTLGRTTEITRDELNFTKFIDKLRRRFSELFDSALKMQLILKNIITEEEWEEFRENIHYDFMKDNNFTELKDAELLNNRLTVLSIITPFIGKFFSERWVKKEVLRMTDEEIEEMKKEMVEENAEKQNMIEQEPEEDGSGTNPVPSDGDPLNTNWVAYNNTKQGGNE